MSTPNQTITNHRWCIHGSDLIMQKQDNGLLQTLPEQLGLGQSNIYALDQGFSFIETLFNPNRDLAIVSQIDQIEPILVITLALQGSSCFVGHKNQELIFEQGYVTITRFHSSLGQRQYTAGQTVKQCRFAIAKLWLIRYFGEEKTNLILQKTDLKVLRHQLISPQSIFCIQQLLNAKPDIQQQLLYKYGLAISIVAAELANWFDDAEANTLRFSQRDQAMANRARDILCRV